MLQEKQTYRKAYQLDLDRSITLDPGDLISSPDRTGSGFVIQRNTICNTRSRGMILKASDGQIIKNTIEYTAGPGIVLAPEPRYWMEAGFSENVLISGNKLRGNGHMPDHSGSVQAGAISVVADSDWEGWGHAQITIEKNLFERVAGVNIVASSVDGLAIRGNRFIDPLQVRREHGSDHGVHADTVIWLGRVDNVQIDNNVLVGVLPASSEIIKTTPLTRDVHGAAGGVLIQGE